MVTTLIPRTCAIQGSQGTTLLTPSLGNTMGKGMIPRDPCGVRKCHSRLDTAATIRINIETWMTKNGQRSRGPPIGGGWLGIPFCQMCWVLALRL